MRRVACATVVLALLLGLAACAPTTVEPTGPLALSSAQAERLAVSRFRNFDAGVRTIDASVTSTAGTLKIEGWFDFSADVGYASVAVGAAPAGLVWWTHEVVATREAPVEGIPLPRPDGGWQSAPLDPSSTALAGALALVANLGADRPENPQLLAQSDAAWLRSDTVGTTEVDVFIGPSSDSATAAPVPADKRARYWVDETGLMVRFEFASIGSGDGVTVELGDVAAVDLPTTVPGAP
ncbi:MAG: hypothetical protein ACOH1T_11980 [Microbacteriaceae bacterium]